MATIEELKTCIDLHDLALRLGLERPHGSGNYRSPLHKDKSPSLSIFKDGTRWKDHSGDSTAGGSCIDLVMYVDGVEAGEAVRQLHELYDISMDKPERTGPREQKTREEYVAGRCLAQAGEAVAYLTAERKIPEKTVQAAIKAGSLGFNAWTSDKVPAGEPMHGGPAAAFVVRSLNPGTVLAVDMRYLDAELNGGVKTQTLGEKRAVWFSDRRRLERSKVVYLVESPINALSVEAALPYAAAVATRGVGTMAELELNFLRGKQVVICMDSDEPQDGKRPGQVKGRRPGQEAGWVAHERLTALGIAAQMVDQIDWEEAGWNDVNDVLQSEEPEGLRHVLKKLEPWAISGLPGKVVTGRSRMFLPPHDFAEYWRFRVHEDFTRWVAKRGNEEGGEADVIKDLVGFRIQSISRVSVQSYQATMTGEEDAEPNTYFAAAVQVERHGPNLLRRVLDDDQIHNVQRWRKLGPVFLPDQFARMLVILARGAELGAHNAVNFVGLAWRDGKPVVNAGSDCYFTEPEKQCPYNKLTFPSGSKADARAVITAYGETFKRNAALHLLVWSIGTHLKAFLGFWPHCVLQADKGAGKSTLVKRLERTIAFTMFSGESLQTAFRMLTSVSHTSHPVGWEEISARRQDIIDQAVSRLQESYQYTVTRRGAELTEFLISAPVLLAGEDVPVRSLLGKLVRVELTGRKGPLMPTSTPRFPLRQWLEFLAGFTREQVLTVYERAKDYFDARSSASAQDDGATRMVGNYAAVATAWSLLCEFSGIEKAQSGFLDDLVADMNDHVMESSADREPWVWITEILLSEIEAHRYKHPFAWGEIAAKDSKEPWNTEACLIVRTSHVMDHIAREQGLRDKWNGLPVKSSRVYKRQLAAAGVIVSDEVEKTIDKRRLCHMVALSVDRLARYGLHAAVPENIG